MARRKLKEGEYPAWTPPRVTLPDDIGAAMLEMRRFAAMVWNDIIAVFGASMEHVQRVWESAEDNRLCLDWVRHLERTVRHIILVMALQLSPAPPRAWAQRAPGVEPRWRGACWSDPTTWRVSFTMALRPARERPSRAGLVAAPPAAMRRTYGLARRIEALRRAISHTQAYALRHHRRLARMRARDARLNLPPIYGVRPWAFHPWLSSTGAHAVNEGMSVLSPLAARELARWQGLEEEPG